VASELIHIELTSRNHRTLLYLLEEHQDHPEWVTTVAFYKAVQVVEAVFAAHSQFHSHGHDARLKELKRIVFADVFRGFRPLYAASLVARYLVDNASQKLDGTGNAKQYTCYTDYCSPDRVLNNLLKKRLNAVEQHAVHFLSDDGRKQLQRIQNWFDARGKTQVVRVRTPSAGQPDTQQHAPFAGPSTTDTSRSISFHQTRHQSPAPGRAAGTVLRHDCLSVPRGEWATSYSSRTASVTFSRMNRCASGLAWKLAQSRRNRT